MQHLICGETTGGMEEGFRTKCVVKTYLNDAYNIFITESDINEKKYLKKDVPKTNIKYKENDVDVEYLFEENKILINLIFSGGVTTIEFNQKSKETTIIINNSPD